jgi:hypothetical protein
MFGSRQSVLLVCALNMCYNWRILIFFSVIQIGLSTNKECLNGLEWSGNSGELLEWDCKGSWLQVIEKVLMFYQSDIYN